VIIAIDGPAGSGKSSTAKAVATSLGFQHLDSGAFYRTLTLAAVGAGIPTDQWPHLSLEDLDALAVAAHPSTRGYRFTIDGRDVTGGIRSDVVNASVSLMARVPTVRHWLLGRLRAAATTDLVADGRDMGTVVFPDADLKIFLTANAAERALRRLRERGTTEPADADVAAETARLLERDRLDSERDVAPLRQAADATVLDTSDLDFDEQVARIVALARERGQVDETSPGR